MTMSNIKSDVKSDVKSNIKKCLLGLMVAAALPAMGQNISGHITCGGVGVAGVPVSDGVEVVTTDANGYYSMTSAKKYGYVFYSLPRGYEPAYTNTFNPQIWQRITSTDASVAETHDFTLTKTGVDDYTMIIAADAHLAKRTKDRSQYQAGYIAALKREKNVATFKGKKVYSMILGDLTWDNYWYSNKYDLSNFMSDQASMGYPVPLFPVIGNHDNDGGVAFTTAATTDFKSSEPWRKIVAPDYYSFNLGKVHYVVLDNIYYLNMNTGGSYNTGIKGSRNYTAVITKDQINWLKKDLALTDKNMALVVAYHIPGWYLNSSFQTTVNLSGNITSIANLCKDFKKVHFVSGHTHYNYSAHPTAYSNITEHNIAAICATWWWSGYLTGKQICKDGSPAGYSKWEIDGDSINWRYTNISSTDNDQVRLYDMNTVKAFMSTDATAKKLTTGNSAVPTYSSYASNVVMANVYDYDQGWTVSIREADSVLATRRTTDKDPLHVLAYDYPRYVKSGSLTSDFVTTSTSHLFRALAKTANLPITVRVTDPFGRVYYQTIQRPLAYNINMQDSQSPHDLGDVNNDGEVNVADATAMVNKALNVEQDKFDPIVADFDGNGKIDVEDITRLINKMLK